MKTRNVAILLFEGVETLDFCGPFEVFSLVNRNAEPPPFNVFAVAQNAGEVRSNNGLKFMPDCDLESCPATDILVVPGGMGTRREMNNPTLIDWIAGKSTETELTLSVCTGALLLAKAGLLSGLRATTHHSALDLLREVAPDAKIEGERRYVDNGEIVLSAGIASGMDMSLHVVGRLLGSEIANRVAEHMEHEWRRDADA